MTSRQQAGAVVLGLFPAAVAAGAIALGVAGLSSIFLPFGLARTAEPDPGFAVNTAVVTIGVVATIVVALLTLIALTVHATHPSRPRGTVQRVLRPPWRRRIDVPVAALVGLDLAFGSTSRRDLGVYTAIAGVAMASAAACGSLVLVDSVNYLLATPAVYGWTWDLVVPEGDARLLAKDVDVAAASEVHAATISIEGRPIIARGIRRVTGPTPIQVTRGVPPGPGKIVLGARTMADLDVDIGDTVTVSGHEHDQDMRVVGEAVFAGVIDVPYAGVGAALLLEDLTSLGPADTLSDAVALSLADGVDPDEFAGRITATTGVAPETASQPVESIRVRQIQGFPWALTAFLTTIGLVALMHSLLVTVSQSKKDLAVLSALGMRSRGILQSLAVTTSSLALIGVTLGVPFGIAAGRALWRNLARGLGVVVSVEVPWSLIILVTVAIAALLAAVALLPVRRAWRTPPTSALHTE
jgi:hypothetical protein